MGDRKSVELAALDAVEERRAFDEVVEREGEEAPFGRAVDRVAGAADPLQEGRNRARRADLADELDVADVDAQFERGGGDHRPQFAALEPLLGGESPLLGHAPVMRGDRVLAEPVRELARHTLAHAPRVDEDERGLVRADEPGEPLVDLAPDLVGHHRFERRVGRLDGEVARTLVAGIDDRDLRGLLAVLVGADEQARHGADGVLGRGKPDALQAVAAERRQAFERQRQMRAALVRRDGVDLVDDHGPRRRQHPAAGFGAEQHVERLGRGHEDVRRLASHAGALVGRGIAGADQRADGDVGKAAESKLAPDPLERRFEIAVDVVRQRLERRDVDDMHGVRKPSVEPLADEVVDGGEEGGQRLARARRRGDQRMPPGLDRGPGVGLGRARAGKGALEPRRDGGMEEGLIRAGEGLPGRLAQRRNATRPGRGRGWQSEIFLVRAAARAPIAVDHDAMIWRLTLAMRGRRSGGSGPVHLPPERLLDLPVGLVLAERVDRPDRRRDPPDQGELENEADEPRHGAADGEERQPRQNQGR